MIGPKAAVLLAASALAVLAPVASAANKPAPAAQAQAGQISGLWDGIVTVDGTAIPFPLQLSQTKAGVRGVFFDGERPINPSTRGSFQGGRLQLAFDAYATKLDARLQGGVLRGTYASPTLTYPIEARPHRAVTYGKGPAIAGDWLIASPNSKNEKAWRLIVQQKGDRAYATILRVDGDTGTLSGGFRDGRYILSRYAGERPGLLEIRPQADGSLGINLIDDDFGKQTLKAHRPNVAAKQGVEGPADPARFTTVRDQNEPFRFSAKDFAGKTVTNASPQFRGKVVLVNVMGSWCPNCHDEAPFMEALYKKYHSRGLEIVALDFEKPDQLPNPWRIKAFVKKYGLSYTVLLAGDRANVLKALPQTVNLKAWPTTFFLGRDGKVKIVHVGFTSPGSGAHDAELKAEITREVEGLLGAPAKGRL